MEENLKPTKIKPETQKINPNCLSAMKNQNKPVRQITSISYKKRLEVSKLIKLYKEKLTYKFPINIYLNLTI